MPKQLSWCEIDTLAMENNVSLFRKRLTPGSRLGIVVKSEAYGHGLKECAERFVRAGADWLIVNHVHEALQIRECGIGVPLYVCGHVPSFYAEDVVRAKARIVLYDVETLEAVAKAGREGGWDVPIHLKIETGTNRQGLGIDDALEFAKKVNELDGVTLEGLTTHFADIEDTRDHRFAFDQLKRLREAAEAFRKAGLSFSMVHAANSAAAILYPDTHGDMVRVGISAYGLWPSNETYVVALQKAGTKENSFLPELKPCLSWKCRIAQIKDVPPGDYIGYGRTYRATHSLRIAVLPIGYFEGLDRRLSGVGHVLVNGVRAPIRGRICMNMTMIDVTHIPNMTEDSIVTLIGRDGDETISAEQMADWIGSINYEVISRINPQLQRVYL